ncbi:DUF4249 domain-containing protein [uncultured Croceitalea sp.]|uniref:DUF4249 domain-containing protein n=1 Tax=uncultured Croceitalea sp. TaxID=1798908 RepID=UPI0033066AD7
MKVVSNYLKKSVLLIFVGICTVTCTEPFEVELDDFENILVIEASITDEMKRQEIFISRTYTTDEEVVQESGAIVNVSDDVGNTYTFQENGAGLYVSSTEFAALSGRNYRLQIETADGRSYSSSTAALPPSGQIDEVKAMRTTNKGGVDGVAILVSGSAEGEETAFFRYKFEETYRIVSFYNPQDDLVIVSENPPELELMNKTREERICYNTLFSNKILIADSDNFSANRVVDFQIRFIERLDRIVVSRYSILAIQFTQSEEANVFYKTLQEFSGNTSLFLQTQPGFLAGNVSSENDEDEKVLGLFEVTSVSTKRLFFSFNEIFGIEETRFSPECSTVAGFGLSNPILFDRIKSGRWKYINEDPPNVYNVAQVQCVDCNVLGTNVVPDFWED